MKQADIDKLNEAIMQARRDINEVRAASVALGDGYAEAMANVALDCLQRLWLENKKGRRK